MKEKKLGAGIIIISVLIIIGTVISIPSSIITLMSLEQSNEILRQVAPELQMTASEIIIGLIVAIVELVGVILIFMKKPIGIYMYFGGFIIGFVYNIITRISMPGMILSLLISLILPILYAIFIYLKRQVFGLGVNEDIITDN